MTRDGKAAKVVTIALVLAVAVIGALVVRIPAGPSAQDLQREIDKMLPIGSSRDLVALFAKNHDMEQSSYLMPERTINSIKRGVSKGLFFESSVYVRFYFDEKHTLQRFTVEEVSTGP